MYLLWVTFIFITTIDSKFSIIPSYVFFENIFCIIRSPCQYFHQSGKECSCCNRELFLVNLSLSHNISNLICGWICFMVKSLLLIVGFLYSIVSCICCIFCCHNHLHNLVLDKVGRFSPYLLLDVFKVFVYL